LRKQECQGRRTSGDIMRLSHGDMLSRGLSLPDAEVRGAVIIIEHPDADAAEPAELRHQPEQL